MTTYTDTQLKQALAKMLPETCIFQDNCLYIYDDDFGFDGGHREVLDTELLHLCWLVEETINNFDKEQQYAKELYNVNCGEGLLPSSLSGLLLTVRATWQQRTIALCKVKGIEIV